MPPFTGRCEELALLDRRREIAAAGTAQVVLIEGQQGMGKSALVAEFNRRLPADVDVRTASGDLAETGLEYGILLQLMRRRSHAWADPLAAGADFLAMLDERCTPSPVVLVVDDAHLADKASLVALTFSLRRLEHYPVLAVLAVTVPPADRLPAGLLKLAVQGDNVVTLGPLSSREVGQLATTRGMPSLPRSAVARLTVHTGGNPWHVTALLSELTAADLTRGGAFPAPRSYASLLVKRLATTSTQARLLLRAASILTDDSSLGLVGRVAELFDRDVLERAMDELVDSGLATRRHADDGWHLGFTHPLARAAVYDDLGAVERRELNLRAARLVPHEAGVLHQVAATEGEDPELAVSVAGCAHRARADGDVHRGAELLLITARLSDDAAAARHLLDASALFLVAGDVAAARTVESRLGRLPLGARRACLQAKIAWFTGRPSDAEGLTRRVWEQVDDLDRPGRGALAVLLAQLCNVRGAGREAAAWADLALSLELTDGLRDSAVAAGAVGRALDGRVGDGLAVLDPLPTDAAVVLVGHHHRLTARGVLRAMVDDLAGAETDLASLCAAADLGVLPHRLLAMGVLSHVEYRKGGWDASLTLAEKAVSLAEESEQTWLSGALHACAVLVCAGRGRWMEAEQHLREGQAAADQLGDPATFAVCGNARVHLAACRGQPEEVVARAAPLVALGGGPAHEPGLLDWPVHYASALVDLNRPEDAERVLAVFRSAARSRGSQSRLAALARVRGEMHTLRRQHDDARLAFEEAISLGASADALEAGMVRWSYGRFLRRRGERRAAARHLQDARGRFHALEALPFLRRCDDELAVCGVLTTSERSRSLLLTPQERVVARLIGRGMSNADAAQLLVLSKKTVDYHLGNVYAKLGVHNRAQLVTQLGATD